MEHRFVAEWIHLEYHAETRRAADSGGAVEIACCIQNQPRERTASVIPARESMQRGFLAGWAQLVHYAAETVAAAVAADHPDTPFRRDCLRRRGSPRIPGLTPAPPVKVYRTVKLPVSVEFEHHTGFSGSEEVAG